MAVGLVAATAVGSVAASAAPAAPPVAAASVRVAPPLRAIGITVPAAVPVAVVAAPMERVVLRPAAFTQDLPDDRAGLAVAPALAQIGLPYMWGGDGPTAGEAGFDCSGLTRFAYAAAGITLPRTAHTQYYAGPLVPPGAPLRPGDLVFYGMPERVHHVGLYLGDGRMVNAPRFGEPVQVSYYRWRGDDYLGATRPAAVPGDPGLLPPLPAPVPLPLPVPEVFAAPAATLPEVLPGPADPQPPEPDSAAAALAAAAEPLLSRPPSAGPSPAGPSPAGPSPAGPSPAGPSPAGPSPAGPSPAGPSPAGPSPAGPPLAWPAKPGSASTRPAAPPVVAAPAPAATRPRAAAPVLTPPAPPGTADRITSVALPAGWVALRAVQPWPSGLPDTTGSYANVVRVPAALLAGAVVGTPIVLTRSGPPERHTVVARTVVDTPTAALLASSGAEVVLSLSEDGWTVLTSAVIRPPHPGCAPAVTVVARHDQHADDGEARARA